MHLDQYRRHVALITALRSGEYEQTKGRLKRGAAYCCLGLACELVKDTLEVDWDRKSLHESIFLGQSYIMPEEVCTLYGLDHSLGPYLTITMRASEMNDAGFNFLEIAKVWEDWLNEQLVKLATGT